jgi:excisionase family DNA binding protein
MTPDSALSTAPMLLTVAEVAERWRLSDETIHRWCRQGALPYVKMPGGLKRFRLDDIESFERSFTDQPPSDGGERVA